MSDYFSDMTGLDGGETDSKGKVIPPAICNAWVAPNGRWYYVPAYGHSATAEAMGTDSCSLEARGYVHLSLAYRSPSSILVARSGSITQAQADAIFDAAMSVEDGDLRHRFMAVVNYAMSLVA